MPSSVGYCNPTVVISINYYGNDHDVFPPSNCILTNVQKPLDSAHLPNGCIYKGRKIHCCHFLSSANENSYKLMTFSSTSMTITTVCTFRFWVWYGFEVFSLTLKALSSFKWLLAKIFCLSYGLLTNGLEAF